MRLLVLMVSLVALALSSPAFAEVKKKYKRYKVTRNDRGVYFGASTGWTTVKAGFSNPTGSAKVDEGSTGLKIYGGYQFNQYIGVEGYWSDLGYTKLTAANGDTFQFSGTSYNATSSIAMNIEADHYGGVFTAGLPLHFGNRRQHTLRPFAKVGLGVSYLQLTGNVGSLSLAVDERSYEAIFGAGLQLNLGKVFAVRAEYEFLPNPYDTSSFMSLGLQARF